MAFKPHDKPQAEQKHPDRYERDLNPDHLAGQNIGGRTTLDEEQGHRASDLKELHAKLPNFRNDELDEIPVLTAGARLKQGATYLDLSDPGRKPFTASGVEIVEPGSYVVPKHDCPHSYWNRLLGHRDPQRTV